MKFQIGPDKHAYIYTDTDMVVNSSPVYKCRRGQDAGTEHVLFLSRAKDGKWIAREAHKDSPEPVAYGKKIFMTQESIIDITKPGEVHWMWYKAETEAWINFNSAFYTKILDD